jgi:hypothetical protein
MVFSSNSSEELSGLLVGEGVGVCANANQAKHNIVAAKMVIVGIFKVHTATGRSDRSFPLISYLSSLTWLKSNLGFRKTGKIKIYFVPAGRGYNPAPAELYFWTPAGCDGL